ncbi:MAG TPA: DUF5684 domain-containing protein [Thermoanaerobaculia bacterium]|nr:DUF5684 domain-containing protein [Thermoanaerobaculia bacterium]
MMSSAFASIPVPLLLTAPAAIEPSPLATGIGCVVSLIGLALGLLVLAGMWKVFAKAGQAGWKSLIPIYNIVVLLEIVGRPLWWLVLLIIPLVNVVAAVLVCLDLARSFGRSALYGIGLLVLAPFFIVHLGFSSAQYQGAAAA